MTTARDSNSKPTSFGAVALTVLCVLSFGIGPSARCQDWAKIEADYVATKKRLIEQGPPPYYLVRSGDKALVFDSRPEFGIGFHRFDETVAATLKRANIRFVRHTMYWYAVENTTEPGKYDEEALKHWAQLVAQLDKNGLIPVIVVHGNAPGCSFANRQESYERFAKFMAFVARRYPKVRYWELWNEMDGAFTDLFGAGVKENGADVPMRQRGKYYAEMLKIVSPAIRKANPDAIILTGGMDNWTEFPTGIYEGGGKDYFDIMNMHSYGIPLQWAFVLRGAEMRQLMKRHGDAEKPLWNTEFGLEAGSVVRAWGMPKANEDAGAIFDKHQKEMIMDCIEFNSKSGLYQKCLAYQYLAVHEFMNDEIKAAKLKFPAGMELDDYSAGFVRRDGVTPKPVLQYVIDSNPNERAGLSKPLQLKVPLRADGPALVTVNSDYPVTISPSDDKDDK